MSKTTAEIRQTFLNFFQKKQHHWETSSSLIPHNDSTLLFTNAGMNQFKNFFLGIERPTYRRATTAQRCLRAGGKHNDLENVGYTSRHHTFFEMLGNFSFGDYFKKEAITAAWELLTSDAWFALPKARLWITVYQSDEESYAIWADDIGVPAERIIRIGDNKGAPYASDNFWQMGNSGPCGPCTEIFYDHGEAVVGGPPGSLTAEGDRYVEIWNLVFMQFNRQSDGTMQPLPTPCVDTGMGLERISAVLQGVTSNYDIDIFHDLIAKTAEITQTAELHNPSLRPSLCIISDHIRACAFLMADGVVPSNDGPGYVLRRIIRRAVRHGQKLGIKTPFFYKLTAPLIAIMGDMATEVKRQQKVIEQQLQAEELQFTCTLQRSLTLLTEQLATLEKNELSGAAAFKLYDTYGLPLDLTIDICREHNITVNIDEFNQAMAFQRQRAQQSSQFAVTQDALIPIEHTSIFCGYEQTQQLSEVVSLWCQGKDVAMINVGEEATVFLNQTPFYGTAGGQVGDQGWLTSANISFTVRGTQRYGQSFAHVGKLTQGQLSIGDQVTAQIDNTNRQAIRLNHSATHLLHAAVRKILGKHVLQKGSLVNAAYLRFDFSHITALTLAQRWEIEQLVNAQIRHNDPIITEILDLATAKAKGAMALFDERYGEQVRVLTIGEFSTELCGGTHAARTGDIGLFHILSESGISNGVRRIEAVTGAIALQRLQHQQQCLLQATSLVKDNSGQKLVEKVQSLLDNLQYLNRKVQQLQEKIALCKSIELMNSFITIKDVKLIARIIHDIEVNTLKNIVDNLKHRLSTAVILLATHHEGKVYLVAGVTQDLIPRITATELIDSVARQVGGKGGGRPDLAQASGDKVNAVATTLTSVADWIRVKL